MQLCNYINHSNPDREKGQEIGRQVQGSTLISLSCAPLVRQISLLPPSLPMYHILEKAIISYFPLNVAPTGNLGSLLEKGTTHIQGYELSLLCLPQAQLYSIL